MRERLVKAVVVRDGEHTHRFRCENLAELKRASTLLSKEQGTVEWIASEVKPGDVFYDVGANVGIYTLLAARRVGEAGLVCAFEPHVPTAHSLLRNVAENALQGRVKVLTCALHEREGHFDFNYYRWTPGSSMSQLDGVVDADEREFTPVGSELKYATTVDLLVERRTVPQPDHVKIDVDGNELLVLRGMDAVLEAPRRPRSIQVEINSRYRDRVYSFMEDHGYREVRKHYTASGKKRLAAGADVEKISYNAVFSPQPGVAGSPP
jgi:FkbM family methyltransferase